MLGPPAAGAGRATASEAATAIAAATPHRVRSCPHLTGRSYRCVLPLAGVPIHLRHRLKQLPADHAILLDHRPKVPEGEAVADEVSGGGDRRHPPALVHQGGLAEVVAPREGGVLPAPQG